MLAFSALVATALLGAPFRPRGGARHAIGLGAVFSAPPNSNIFGFDVDENGTDAIFDDTNSTGSASEIGTFDATTGRLTKVVKKVTSPSGQQELVTFGIFGNDVGFVDDERELTLLGERDDRYDLLSPVSGNRVTGRWEAPHPKDLVLTAIAQNQTTDVQVIGGIRLGAGTEGRPLLFVWNSATNATLNMLPLKALGPLAQDTATNQAVIATGTALGATEITLVNLANGRKFSFIGLDNGAFGSGSINGLAVDSSTGIAATATEENAQVEFYTLSNGDGIAAQLPGTGNSSEFNSATAVTNDPVNGLFLVAQPNSSIGAGSTIYVYDEHANLVETLRGFSFAGDRPLSFGVKVAINPSLRIGWVNGPKSNQLQQFFY